MRQAFKRKTPNHRVTSRIERGPLARRRIPSERTFQRDTANLSLTRTVCGHGRGDQQPLEAKYFPDPDSDYQRAGSEIGIAYINGQKEQIHRPRVRHKEGGEVKLTTYQAASS